MPAYSVRIGLSLDGVSSDKNVPRGTGLFLFENVDYTGIIVCAGGRKIGNKAA